MSDIDFKVNYTIIKEYMACIFRQLEFIEIVYVPGYGLSP